MAAFDAASSVDPDPGKDVAAKTFDDRHALACRVRGAALRPNRAIRQFDEDLLDQPDGLFHFADTYPEAGVYIALFKHRDFEFEFVIGSIARPAPRVAASA